jgi:hypothetical protein
MDQSPAQSGASFIFDTSMRRFAFDVLMLCFLFAFFGIGEWILEKALGLSINKVIDNAEQALQDFVEGKSTGAWQPATYIFCVVWLSLIYLVSLFAPH